MFKSVAVCTAVSNRANWSTKPTILSLDTFVDKLTFSICMAALMAFFPMSAKPSLILATSPTISSEDTPKERASSTMARCCCLICSTLSVPSVFPKVRNSLPVVLAETPSFFISSANSPSLGLVFKIFPNNPWVSFCISARFAPQFASDADAISDWLDISNKASISPSSWTSPNSLPRVPKRSWEVFAAMTVASANLFIVDWATSNAKLLMAVALVIFPRDKEKPLLKPSVSPKTLPSFLIEPSYWPIPKVVWSSPRPVWLIVSEKSVAAAFARWVTADALMRPLIWSAVAPAYSFNASLFWIRRS